MNQRLLVYSTPVVAAAAFSITLAVSEAMPNEDDCYSDLMQQLGDRENYTLEQAEVAVDLTAIWISDRHDACDYRLVGHSAFPSLMRK